MKKHSRRQFLKRSLAVPAAYTATRVGGVSMTSMALGGLAGGTAHAAECGASKSLVCLFLAGGADSFNMFVPIGNSYDQYRTTRNDLAVAEEDLLEVGDSQQGAFGQADVGNLALLPESLFAHNTQQKLWQNAAGKISGSGAFGWGGAMGVQLAQCNSAAAVPAAISVNGANTWQTSQNGNYIALSPNADIERMYGFDPGVATWIPQASRQATSIRLQQMLEHASSSGQPLLMREAADVLSRSKDVTQQLEETFENFTQMSWVPDSQNKLERQLHLVTRLIEARESLGMQRQLFFVRMGGWDTHSNQNERMPFLMNELNSAVGNFRSALSTLGLNDSVTTFTASDFGRTLTSNGNGTDRLGWA